MDILKKSFSSQSSSSPSLIQYDIPDISSKIVAFVTIAPCERHSLIYCVDVLILKGFCD